ncbi:MAG: hypothetical protein JW797_16050 [Bradymonadales bacterium]|nr:hypothetical protein [Bradymonadales bacterium]
MKTLHYLVCALMSLGWLTLVQPVEARADEAEHSISAEEKSRRTRVRRPRTRRVYRYRYVPSPYWGYYRHYHTYPHLVYPPGVWVEPVTTVVVEQPVIQTGEEGEVALAAAAAPATPTQVTPGASIQFRLGGMSGSDTQLSTEQIEGPNLIGFGAACRIGLHRYWMLELGLDVLAGSENGLEQVTVPLTASAIAHFLPQAVVDPYAIAGLGVMFTEMDDPSYSQIEQYVQMSGHLGGGLQIQMGALLLTGDVRFLIMQARPERQYTSTIEQAQEEEFIPTVRDGSGSIDTTLPPAQQYDRDEVNLGVQFFMGLGWQF